MLRRLLPVAVVLVCAWVTLGSAAAGEDLTKLYPATREWSQSGLFPVANAEDVWELASFELALGDDLAVKCKDATVVLGHDGTDVLWAVVLPDKPTKLAGKLAPEGESAQSLVLRFAPAELGRVFPAKSVGKRGDPWLRHEALRIAQGKMVWKWCTPAGNPTIVPKGVTVVDVDTVEGPRRFFALDHAQGKAARIDDFTDKPTPPVAPIEKATALAVFDEVWGVFDKEYAGFGELPDVDWDALGKRYRKAAEAATSNHGLAAVLTELVAQLQDLHAWVTCDGRAMQGYSRPRPLNGSFQACRAALSGTRERGRELVSGTLAGGVGYLGVLGLQDKSLPELFDAALDDLREAPALIVDLRFNGGGDELLARGLAGRFATEPVVYSRSRYRSGPKHDQLGAPIDRVLEPRGPWRYERPVIALIGPRTLSSAESFAAMLGECPNVTLLGAPTGGSSGNPRRLELAGQITVNVPRWLDLLPDGTALERRGVPPDVLVESAPADFTEQRDPVLEAALARLAK